ncbi:MAG: chlorite dismutase, partial [Alicyclobacillus sp.]|nr:chlorite dismutase [Alicyclobacillus sp.]
MQTMFTGHLAWKLQDDWTRMEPAERADAVRQSMEEVNDVFKRREGHVSLRGAYLTKAFRADTDVLWFMYSPSADDIQDVVIELGRTRIGRFS